MRSHRGLVLVLAAFAIGLLLGDAKIANAVYWARHPATDCLPKAGGNADVTTGRIAPSSSDAIPEAFCPIVEGPSLTHAEVCNLHIVGNDASTTQGFTLASVLNDPASWSWLSYSNTATDGPYTGPMNAAVWVPSEWTNPAYTWWLGGVRVWMPGGEGSQMSEFFVYYCR